MAFVSNNIFCNVKYTQVSQVLIEGMISLEQGMTSWKGSRGYPSQTIWEICLKDYSILMTS